MQSALGVRLWLAGGAIALLSLPTIAQEAPATLPVRDVVLFNSGVGYFQRAGRVEGEAALELSFRKEQINDILKSLVLFDPGGTVRPVTYQANEPISRRLRNVGGALGPTVSLADVLRKFQGARMRVEVGADASEGRLVSVSMQAVTPPLGNNTNPITRDVLNLLTETGLKAIPLDSASQVRLLDERLARELQESLELLATGLDDDRRSVQLRFTGNAAREVRAGYLQEMPVWKTTYRLVLDRTGKPYLQGWALVENTTDEDWQNVRLSLVSGRPVSFIQDLYQPLYVPRPIVQPQLVGSPLPQTYGERLELQDRAAGEADAGRPVLRGAAGPPGPPGPRGMAGGFGGGGFGMRPATPQLLAESELRRQNIALSLGAAVSGVVAQAAGAERGDLFEYAIAQPISLAKSRAAMVPIVTAEVEGQKVSIFDPAVDSRRALRGFRLRNSTGLHLAGGPITVFQDGIYAGDSQIEQLQPKEDRLLSYAVDLDLVTGVEAPKFRTETLSIVAQGGVLVLSHKLHRDTTFTFRNKSGEPRIVLVQQAVEPEYKLVEPAQPAEKTADHYRFEVTVPATQTARLLVRTEHVQQQRVILRASTLETIEEHVKNGRISERLRAALKQLVVHKRRVAALGSARSAREGEVKAIDEEQARIRMNMAQLDRTNALYIQYVKKLTDQEARIEALRVEMARLRAEEATAQKELTDFLDHLTAE